MKTYQVYSADFRILGTVSLIPRYAEQSAAEALSAAQKQYPGIIGLMVSPLRTYEHAHG